MPLLLPPQEPATETPHLESLYFMLFMATPNSVCVLCMDGCSVWACVAMDREMKMFHHQFYEPHYSGPWQREAETGVMDTLDTAIRSSSI